MLLLIILVYFDVLYGLALKTNINQQWKQYSDTLLKPKNKYIFISEIQHYKHKKKIKYGVLSH